jgi:hypothetical protein
MAIHYLPVSWKTYHTAAQKLAATILDQHESIDLIVAIARGGLSLGLILSDFLRIPISTIVIQSYTDIQKQGELKITGKLQTPIRGKNIILVDDIADSGKTFKRAIAYLRRFGPKSITTASLFYKPHSVYRPDYFAKQSTDWILLPHEVTEWIYTFTQKLQKEGKSKADIQRFLEKLKFTDDQIAFVRRHYLK